MTRRQKSEGLLGEQGGDGDMTNKPTGPIGTGRQDDRGLDREGDRTIGSRRGTRTAYRSTRCSNDARMLRADGRRKLGHSWYSSTLQDQVSKSYAGLKTNCWDVTLRLEHWEVRV